MKKGYHRYTVTGICAAENGAVAYWVMAASASAARASAVKRASECDDLEGPIFRGWLNIEADDE